MTDTTKPTEKPAGPQLVINATQLRSALELVAPDFDADEDQREADVCIQYLPARMSTEGEPMEAGLYCWLADYPEEGCIPLRPDEKFPSPSVHRQASAARTRDELLDYAQTFGAVLGDFSGTVCFEPGELERFVAALTAAPQSRQASAGQEGVTDVWDYEVMSVDGQWCHESRTGEPPDCEMFVIRNLRKRTPLDTPRLQQLFGDAIEGALAFGFQGNNPPPEGHWLWRFWNIGRAEATKSLALSTAAPESKTSSDDLKQRLVDSIVRHCVDGKVWAPMAEAWARHAVNEAFDGIAAPTAGETL